MAKNKVFKSMDGNEAASYISYAFTEVATIYPITPSSPMANHVDEWSAHGMKNIFGTQVKLMEMQAEFAACGALQGALETGSLGSTYTSSQGLMLMIPPMYRIAGLNLPAVMHVAARSVGTHSVSIFGDQSDVMACRQTGWAQLASSSVQECMDMGAVAHLSAIKGHVPVQHFFDGFRTSHEIQKIEVLDFDDMAALVDQAELKKFRDRALNPEHPTLRHSGENDDIFFQHRESINPIYSAFPEVVEGYMEKISALTGRDYKLFNYFGAPDAERVIVAMGSVCDAAREVVDYLNAQGEKVGLIQVHLYRPFSLKHFMSAIPETCKVLTTLDRTKEPGALGEPLYEDVSAALIETGRMVRLLGGRYGLSSKDTTPAQIKAVFDNMKGEMKNHFTVGINDDVTHTSLPVGENIVTAGKSIISCKFWGLGSDGTVGANKNSCKIIGDNTDQYVQAYFQYDAKKSGGLTRSHLRFGHEPILSTYYVTMADFVACHKQSYMHSFDIVSEVKPGGTFLLNTRWKGQQLIDNLPNRAKRILAERKINFYTIDATDIAAEIGLGNRTSTVLQAAFFKLSGVLPIDEAEGYMKDAAIKTFSKKGDKIVNMNLTAIEKGLTDAVKIDVPVEWASLPDDVEVVDENLPEFVRKVLIPINKADGDNIPVSTFTQYADGVMPVGMAKFEKRGVADNVPVWDPDKCIGCNRCSLVCPHAAIRPILFTEEEAAEAPESCVTKKALGKGFENYKYRIQVDVLDCQGCGSCANVCPAKEKALKMVPLDDVLAEQKNWDYCMTLSEKKNPMNRFSAKGSQFEQPLYEFSGACPGCGETPYIKLLTQLFGDRMYVANATGCSQAYGFFTPTFPQTTNKRGFGPAFSNSLFENNAEFALGMSLSTTQMREQTKLHARNLAAVTGDEKLKAALEAWLAEGDDVDKTEELSDAVRAAIAETKDTGADVDYLREREDTLTKKAIWMVGGDGWAYDIGFGGLDHVMASGLDLNVLVVDNELYANTGGQSSKATPIGASVQFAAAGKGTPKKDLGMILANYGYVYVAQVAMGANPEHLIKCLKEAAAHKGPSIVIAYAPCINHGLSKGMAKSMDEEKAAVECGFWPLYRYNPENEKEGKNPFTLDSAEPNGKLREYMMGETRFASLTRVFPERAEQLFAEAEEFTAARYAKYKKLAGN
ncbi:MAG: pyruvate:ferredoxin (flavodoxin) oxidoreductase [Oscillospiraceae bacterium]|nr:pyruvate:ferredoxin (flavodoxin) oxidoreductase [Oscillospiraceae bacterium]